jgi:hypothetical protein
MLRPGMVEILGFLLALLIVGVATLLQRGWHALRRHRARLRGAPLRLSRAIRRRQGARIEDLSAELARARRLLRALERERDALRQQRGGPPESRFQRAKRAFALHFHPDHLNSHPEQPVRRRIFQEFWPVLRRIERS